MCCCYVMCYMSKPLLYILPPEDIIRLREKCGVAWRKNFMSGKKNVFFRKMSKKGYSN